MVNLSTNNNVSLHLVVFFNTSDFCNLKVKALHILLALSPSIFLMNYEFLKFYSICKLTI